MIAVRFVVKSFGVFIDIASITSALVRCLAGRLQVVAYLARAWERAVPCRVVQATAPGLAAQGRAALLVVRQDLRRDRLWTAWRC